MYAERIVKFLLWQRGGCKVYVGGPEPAGQYIADAYSANGARAFDHKFMGEDVLRQCELLDGIEDGILLLNRWSPPI